MENNKLLDSLRRQFSDPFEMLEKIIDVCPDELWNKKTSGYVFWHQIFHALYWVHFWLRDEKTDFNEPFTGETLYPHLEKTPEKILSKNDLRIFCKETKELAEKWVSGKDDSWLNLLLFREKTPTKMLKDWTYLDAIISQISHLMYHVGHCDAILRENSVKGVWNE